MKLFGREIKTLTPKMLEELCNGWSEFARHPVAYKNSVVIEMIVQSINEK